MKLRSGSLKRKIKLIKLYPNSSRKKKTAQINKHRNEREVTTNITEIQRITRDYYKQLYANKMDNLEEMDKFLAMYNVPRLNQEEIENMNRLIISTETELII